MAKQSLRQELKKQQEEIEKLKKKAKRQKWMSIYLLFRDGK